MSLAVKDLQASREFYTKLGFTACGGDAAQGWLVLRNGAVTIGLFRGMFERNLLTFNPGWDAMAQPVTEFTVVRDHQKRLESLGIAPVLEADEQTAGPASCMIVDPDARPNRQGP